MIPARNLGRFFHKALSQPAYATRVGWRRLKAYALRRMTAGNAPAYPESITLFMTYKCNLRCKMCGQWGDKGVTRAAADDGFAPDMTLDDMQRVIDEIAPHGTSVTLFGGEPLLDRHFIDLTAYIKRKGLHCLVITNGTLVKTYAEQLVTMGLDELNLSLDGFGATHDEIRGIPGLFDRIADGIAALNTAKERFSAGKPLINLQCTINKDNYRRLPELIDAARLFKAHSLTFHHLIHLNDPLYAAQEACMTEHLPGTSSRGWRGFVFDPGMDIDALLEALRTVRTIAAEGYVSVYPNLTDDEIRAYYRDPAAVPASYAPRCVSPWVVAYVFPDGAVRPCLNLSYAFGNVRTATFKDIWNGAAARHYRTILKERGMFPACARCTELFRY